MGESDIAQHHAYLLGVARNSGAGSAAEDAVQDAYVTLLSLDEGRRAQVRNLRAFLAVVVRRRARRLRQQGHRLVPLPESMEAKAPLGDTSTPELRVYLHEVEQQLELTPEERDVLEHLAAGDTQAETARALDVRRQRVNRVLTGVRSRVGGE